MEILPQLLANALIAGSIYALASAGLSLTCGLLRILNFAHGSLMMVGAYVFYWGYVALEFNWPLAAFVTLLAVVALAVVSLRIFIAPFMHYSFILSFVTTLSLATILESTVSIIAGVNVKSLPAHFDNTSFEFAGVFITPLQIIIILSALILLGLMGFVIHSTRFGRAIRAASENEYSCQALGVDTGKLTFLVFCAGSLCAAYAGILVGYETNMQPTMGNSYTIKAFAAMILGGLGNVWGTVAGSYILALIENLSIGIDVYGYSLPAGYKDAFAFVIILGVLLVRPRGLLNVTARRV